MARDNPTRQHLIDVFLNDNGWGHAKHTPIQGDASTRAYEKLQLGSEHAVLMNAPFTPAKDPYTLTAKLAGSDPQAFICLATELRRRGFSAPRILAADLDNGLLLLEDLGTDMFAQVLKREPHKEREIYSTAISCLAALYRSSFSNEITARDARWHIAHYDAPALMAEADLFLDWYIPAFDKPLSHDARAEWQAIWAVLLPLLNAHAPGLALRDFHAENIFWLPERDGAAKIGLIDFQDALFAHPGYDLVSLLEDARRDVDACMVDDLIHQFCTEAGIGDDENFRAAYAVMGAQRNAKILGIFVRLAKRDGKQHYLDMIPRVAEHFKHDIAHPALEKLHDWVKRNAPSLFGHSTNKYCRQPAKPITTAMVMAAGHGTRMRPLTDNTCKALVRLGGKTLIDHMLDRLDAAGITRAVVNVHAFADQLQAHLRTRTTGPKIIISDEREALLETGGGLVKALPLLGDDPILICNIDAVWTEDTPTLTEMMQFWDARTMDELLLLAPMENTIGYHGKGDFISGFDLHIYRRQQDTAPYVYAGVQIFKPGLASGFPQEKFSRNKIWDVSLSRSKIFGFPMHGLWMHVGDPQALIEAEAALAKDKS